MKLTEASALNRGPVLSAAILLLGLVFLPGVLSAAAADNDLPANRAPLAVLLGLVALAGVIRVFAVRREHTAVDGKELINLRARVRMSSQSELMLVSLPDGREALFSVCKDALRMETSWERAKEACGHE